MSANEVEYTEANFEAETGAGVALIDFWAPWCGPCRMQGPIVEQIAESFADKAKIGKLNVDENPGLAARFGVSGIPTIIITKDGEEAARMVGLQTAEVLTEKLNSLL